MDANSPNWKTFAEHLRATPSGTYDGTKPEDDPGPEIRRQAVDWAVAYYLSEQAK